jgi:ATP-dependent DNA ligase
MLLQQGSEAAGRPEWLRELKLDGYGAVAFKSDGKVSLRSRNDNNFNSRYPAVVRALTAMRDETHSYCHPSRGGLQCW